MSNEHSNGNGKHFCVFEKERNQLVEKLSALEARNVRIEEKLDKLLNLSEAYSDELMCNNYALKAHTVQLTKLSKKLNYLELQLEEHSELEEEVLGE